MFDQTVPLTAEEINLVEGSGLTVAQLVDFWSRFPDQDLDAAIGGAKLELVAKADEQVVPLVSELQDTVPEETAKGEEPNTSPAA